MTDKTLSQLPRATTVSGTDLTLVDTGSPLTTKAITVANLLSSGSSIGTTVATIAALRLVATAADGAPAHVLGYYAAGDGGGGDFYWSASSSATDNGGTVIKPTAVSGAGRWLRPTSANYDVRQFGAIAGQSIATNTDAILAAIAAAGSRELVFSDDYTVNAALVQQDNQKWIGPGGQRAVTITKGFNGTLVTPGNLGTIEDLNFDANGANYTGRGIYVSAGFSQHIERVRVTNAEAAALEFANNVGGGASVHDFEGSTTSPTTVAAIKIRDNTATPRFFSDIWLSGGLFDFASGGNGNTLTNFYIRNFVTDASSTLMKISNGRVASLTDHTTLSGADVFLSNVAFSGQVDYISAQGYHARNCEYGSGFTEDSSNCQFNELTDQPHNYTPTWTQGSGTQPSLGDGTLTGNYVRDGYSCTVSLRLVIGSTTTTGNSGTAYLFSLPFNGQQSFDQRALPVHINDSSAGTDYTGWATVGADENTITIGYNGQGVRDGYPIVWATGDVIEFEFTYKVR